MKTRLLLLLLPLLVVAGCQREATGLESASNLHIVSFRLHPGYAGLSLESRSGSSYTVSGMTGPLVIFNLPAGSYSYAVSAPGYRDYQGVFDLPRNKNLEVWLTPLEP